MIISTGFAQGINLVLRVLARQSGVTCVAFEDPGYGSAQADETVRAALAMGTTCGGCELSTPPAAPH